MTSAPALSRDVARAVYDAYGARQDGQAWYEDAAFDRLVEHGGFAEARMVVEIGCGTGRLAERLLRDALPGDARYLGLDISATMVELARERLSPWSGRAEVRQSDGGFALPPADRIISTYVLDLLSEADIEAFLSAAAGALVPGGRLCLASLATGGLVNRLWSAAYRILPRRLGGCRPVPLAGRLIRHGLVLRHRSAVRARGLSSEVLVAEPARPSVAPEG